MELTDRTDLHSLQELNKAIGFLCNYIYNGIIAEFTKVRLTGKAFVRVFNFEMSSTVIIGSSRRH